ncbi:MAG TPA: alpha-ketoglutarate-dependent dioxygenase AlkB [Thermoanaerobaculia bacterium]|nr:alpha-ketoglutarate-dependent dioxygenase AlkB [Thermoanaerobaculia bacterium]
MSISGFSYEPDIVTPEAHDAIAAMIASEPFAPLRMRGQVSRRRIVSYGLSFVPHLLNLPLASPIPQYLYPVRRLAAAIAGVPEATLRQALITFYPTGAEIGWHVDHANFGDTVAVASFSGSATLFLRGCPGPKVQQCILPRSVYVLTGAARWSAEHRVVAHADRYSVAFRTLTDPRQLSATGPLPAQQ